MRRDGSGSGAAGDGPAEGPLVGGALVGGALGGVVGGVVAGAAGEEVDALLYRFVTQVARVVPLTAVWAHGSLALGDFRPGRSDFDLVAVVDGQLDAVHHERLLTVHRALAADVPLAAKLHCSYLPSNRLSDPGCPHPTWAEGEWFERPVGPVSRRELHNGDLSLYGPPPTTLIPPITDAELDAFVRADLRDYWLPATAARARWLDDIWVDLGLLTYARATVTLRDGRMITKREALDVLADLAAPPAVLQNIHHRRYAPLVTPLTPRERLRRAHRTRTYLRRSLRSMFATAHG